METYCIKCKKKTDSTDISTVETKNKKLMLKGKCLICGIQKTSFIKTSTGGPASSSGAGLIDSLPVEFHMHSDVGENVPGGSFNDQQKYSFCGPGTKYTQRILEGYRGINDLDKVCKLHDEFYNEFKDTKSRNASDVALAQKASEIASNPSYDEKQRKDAKLVTDIMKTKASLGMGISAAKSNNALKDSEAKNSESFTKNVNRRRGVKI